MSATSRQADDTIADMIAPPAADAGGLLADRYRILSGQALPHLALPTADAVAAEDQSSAGPAVFALLCRPGVPWRAQELAVLQRRDCPGVLPILAAGPVGASEQEKRFAVVLRRPEGGNLSPRAEAPTPLSESKVLKKILPQLAQALRALASRGLTHRAIRPANLHYLDAVREEVVLGPFVTGPPGGGQPPVYEPLESAAADVDGRGPGSMASDLYALGATVLALVTGRDPAAGRGGEELLAERVTRGSYRALAGQEKHLSSDMTTLLRGLLCDDPEKRWTLETLESWIEGSGQTVRPPISPHTASQAFEFGGAGYTQPALLAAAFARQPAAAIEVFRGGTLGPWLRHSMRATEAAERLTALLERAPKILASSAAGESVLSAAICQALDPSGPIRYRSLASAPEGVGPIVAAAFARGDRDRLKDLGSLFSCGYFGALAQAPTEARQRPAPKDKFDRLRAMAADTRLGAGLERCLYELNDGLPCQSPLVAGSCILELRDLVDVLDRAAEGAESRRILLDRHIAAFIASRTRKLDPALAELARSAASGALSGIAAVKVLAEMQRLYAPRPVPNLIRWSLDQLKPVIATLKNRARREAIEKALEKAAAAGNLDQMLKILNHRRTAAADEQQFQAARRQYAVLGKAIEKIRTGKKRRQARSLDHCFALVGFASYAALFAGVGYVAYDYLTDLL